MKSQPLVIRFKRSLPGDSHTYGAHVESCITKIVGRHRPSLPSTSFQERLHSGGGYIERHEDGPELFVTVIEQLPNNVTAALALVAAWSNRKKKAKETTTIEIVGKGFSHKIEVRSKEDQAMAKRLISHYGKKGK